MTHIASYIQALAFALLFLIFINGSIGWALVYVLVGAGALSALSCVLSRKHFTVELKPLAGFKNYGERAAYEVIVRKTGFCFLPFIEVSVTGNAEANIRTSLLLRSSAAVTASYRTSRSGMNFLYVNNVAIRDFWGLVQLKLPFDKSAGIAVTPRPIEYGGPEIPQKLLPAEDEETEEGRSAVSGGLPGYEHREYFPGDSLRRINYKLSAKKRRLMVRLEETSGNASTNLLISDNAMSECCDIAFALAKSLVMRGSSVKILHRGESVSAGTPQMLEKMREWLAFRVYGDDTQTAAENSAAVLTEDIDIIFSGAGEIGVCCQR